MKVVFTLFVLIGLGIFLAYKFGGVGSFSPAEQAEKLKTEAQPGVEWQKIADSRAPRKYRALVIDDRGVPGKGAEVKFDRASFDKSFAGGDFNMGFLFLYLFDGEHQYEVYFGPDGKVTHVEKMLTMGDLLNP